MGTHVCIYAPTRWVASAREQCQRLGSAPASAPHRRKLTIPGQQEAFAEPETFSAFLEGCQEAAFLRPPWSRGAKLHHRTAWQVGVTPPPKGTVWTDSGSGDEDSSRVSDSEIFAFNGRRAAEGRRRREALWREDVTAFHLSSPTSRPRCPARPRPWPGRPGDGGRAPGVRLGSPPPPGALTPRSFSPSSSNSSEPRSDMASTPSRSPPPPARL